MPVARYPDENDDQSTSPDSGSGSNDRGSDKTDSSNKDSSNNVNSSDRVDRATGGQQSESDGYKAPYSSDKYGVLGRNSEDNKYGLTEKSNRSSQEKFSLGINSDSKARSGERTSGWNDLDSVEKFKNAVVEAATDFAGGVADFLDKYREMKAVNTKGVDKFYHCMANCEASQRGLGGEIAAKGISYGREATDSVRNVIEKGMSPSDSIADCMGDMKANRVGQKAGVAGERCYDACGEFRPRGFK
jgi:hypothetical protein